MLDFFTIFSKGGIVLWCFQGTQQLFTPAVNALIKSVILQERTGHNLFEHESLKLQYKLDNEFKLVFVVAYQKILQLSYIDKFLSDIQLEFRNKYKDDLQNSNTSRNFDFLVDFQQILMENEQQNLLEKQKVKTTMRTYDQSKKSQKTVSSMIENKKEPKKPAKGKENKPMKVVKVKELEAVPSKIPVPTSNGELDEETIMRNREKLFNRTTAKKSPKEPVKNTPPEASKKNKKSARIWANSGSSKDLESLDFNKESGNPNENGFVNNPTQEEQALVGKMGGALRDIDTESEVEEEEEDDEEEVMVESSAAPAKKNTGSKGFGMFSIFKGLVGAKTLSMEDLNPILEKMKDHLISKNVAAEIAVKLCESVGTKLQGKVLGTFGSVTSTVKTTIQEACVQILSPSRRVDILRDALEARQQKRPYVITFCGVNGVGKSTNLAKICFWLIENGFQVLIAACDTFRAGAVEQLRTHTRKLNALHPPEKHNGRHMVQLYEKGYGKDAAGIAMEAVNFARDSRMDVVLVDTAGRMQDNEPLMKALSKLIKVNQPDLVLFVGEALVGNEAVDQLMKFNQALADHSNVNDPRLIDGIILTKFDTIDDKVGAAISMTYITGQPIVFVGTGQTYTDLRNLNAKAVVNSLLKG
ncbi:hypothetical protein ScPMuIL_002752 [Solemya velum]